MPEDAGRPTLLTEELALNICAFIADGLSVREIASKQGYPASATIFRWVLEDRDGFREKYTRAKEIQAEHLADELIDIADFSKNDWMERHNKDGEFIGWMENGDSTNRAKLRIETRKWAASKLLPKKYGDKIEHDHKGAVGVQLVHSIPRPEREE